MCSHILNVKIAGQYLENNDVKLPLIYYTLGPGEISFNYYKMSLVTTHLANKYNV